MTTTDKTPQTAPATREEIRFSMRMEADLLRTTTLAHLLNSYVQDRPAEVTRAQLIEIIMSIPEFHADTDLGRWYAEIKEEIEGDEISSRHYGRRA